MDLHHGYPVISRHVGRGDDSFDLHQFSKLFRSAFKADFHRRRRLQRGYAKDFSGNAKQQMFTPLDILGSVGKSKAKLAQPVYVGSHGVQYKLESRAMAI